MTPETLALAAVAIFAVAFLYSSVGHAGASGYIAVMSLLGLAPESIKPIALTLNILVASIGAWQFWRAGHFSWRLFWPFALFAVPMAFVGGYVNLPAHLFSVLLGAILIFAAVCLLVRPPSETEPKTCPLPVAFAVGGGIGLVAGLTGTGGGIFLTPILIFMHWARVKHAAAVSVVFILANSIAGLLGFVGSTRSYPAFAFVLLAAAGLGGAAGSFLGSRRFQPAVIKRCLAVVLMIAGAKLMFAA